MKVKKHLKVRWWAGSFYFIVGCSPVIKTNNSFRMSGLVLIPTKTGCVPKAVPHLPNTTASVLRTFLGLGATLLRLFHSDAPFFRKWHQQKGGGQRPLNLCWNRWLWLLRRLVGPTAPVSCCHLWPSCRNWNWCGSVLVSDGAFGGRRVWLKCSHLCT